jgi:drug/metabolite transporter (DMT)-like permease
LLAAEIAAVVIIVVALVGLAWTPGNVAGLEWAGLTGVMIALYTVVDAAAVRESGEALAYTVTLTALSTGLLLPIALWKRGFAGVTAAARARPLALGLASILNIGAYALVLVAASRAPVGLVAAVRESSVVIGAIAGIVLFSEPFGRRRIAGAAAVALGIVALGVV